VVLAVLNNPGPPFHNEIARNAVPIALRNQLNKRDRTKRGLFITKDFFRSSNLSDITGSAPEPVGQRVERRLRSHGMPK
jgi:hypothetical protein